MGLTNKKEEQLKEMPNIRSSVTRSQDGRFVIQKTTISTVKPVEYYRAIVKGSVPEEELL